MAKGERIVDAWYSSVFDDGALVVGTKCKFDRVGLRCFEIEPAYGDASEWIHDTNALTDEYVTLEDGSKLRAADGVVFDYLSGGTTGSGGGWLCGRDSAVTSWHSVPLSEDGVRRLSGAAELFARLRMGQVREVVGRAVGITQWHDVPADVVEALDSAGMLVHGMESPSASHAISSEHVGREAHVLYELHQVLRRSLDERAKSRLPHRYRNEWRVAQTAPLRLSGLPLPKVSVETGGPDVPAQVGEMFTASLPEHLIAPVFKAWTVADALAHGQLVRGFREAFAGHLEAGVLESVLSVIKVAEAGLPPF